MDLFEILQNIGIFTIASGFLTWLLKSFLNKDIELFKHKLKLEQHQHLKLYDKRAEVIVELYKQLDTFYYEMNLLTNPLQMPADMPKEERIRSASKAGNEFTTYYNQNKIYFSKKTNNLLEEIDRSFKVAWINFTTYPPKEINEHEPIELTKDRWESWRKAWATVNEKITPTKKRIEDEFRIILGAEKNEENHDENPKKKSNKNFGFLLIMILFIILGTFIYQYLILDEQLPEKNFRIEIYGSSDNIKTEFIYNINQGQPHLDITPKDGNSDELNLFLVGFEDINSIEFEDSNKINQNQFCKKTEDKINCKIIRQNMNFVRVYLSYQKNDKNFEIPLNGTVNFYSKIISELKIEIGESRFYPCFTPECITYEGPAVNSENMTQMKRNFDPKENTIILTKIDSNKEVNYSFRLISYSKTATKLKELTVVLITSLFFVIITEIMALWKRNIIYGLITTILLFIYLYIIAFSVSFF